MDLHRTIRDFAILYICYAAIVSVASSEVPGPKVFVASILVFLDTVYFILTDAGIVRRYF